MTHDEVVKELQQTTKMVAEIHTAVIGKPEYNQPGIVGNLKVQGDRIAKVEEEQAKTDHKMAKYTGIVVGAAGILEVISYLGSTHHS